MTTPIGADVRISIPAMRNAMIDLCFVWVRFSVRLGDTLRDNFLVAVLVAGELAVGALHTSRIFEEFSAKRTAHDAVELLLDELVSILLVHFFFSLANCTLTAESKIEGLLVAILLHEAEGELDFSDWLDRKPSSDEYWS